MLGYISSTRKKSCHACVKAKRRCDLGYPFCKRCFVKGLDCKYPNAQKTTVRDAEVVIRQSTPDFTPPVASVVSSSAEPLDIQIASDIDANIDPLFLQAPYSSSDSSGSSPESGHNDRSNDWRNDWRQELSVLKRRTIPATQICRSLQPEVLVPSILNEDQVAAVNRRLCAFVPDMAFSGSTLFLHQNLYQKHQPQAYQDCVALSALYLTKNIMNQSILANSINAKISALITTSSTWTLSEHLAAVQALIIYQIIRLFDLDLNLRTQAEKHNSLLEIWSAHLWKRFFNEKPAFQNSFESWVFNESLRRTILMSVFTRCAWSGLTRGGLADQVHVLARLPITRDLEAWMAGPEDWNARALPYITEEEGLVAYGDLAMAWNHKMDVETLDPFGKLLLMPCRGGDDPRLLA
ncbi:Nn.00g036730.m01.CDS01 [Neocucurbitaria sp. VM-36]